jgi:isopropylmalate/homocitrate/citramalate synthase
MGARPWKTARWFVSEWNYLPDAVRELSFAEKIEVHDTTLRDGEQQAGVVFNKEDKVRIAAKLAEAGVHRIEAGMPAVSPTDEAAIREIVKLGLGAKIFAFSRCMIEDIKRAADCGIDGIVVEIPSSEHIIEHAYNWPLEKALDLSIEATQYARDLGLYTVFFPIDATRTNLTQYLNLIERVAAEGHMDALALVDTFGTLSPHAVPYFVKETRERIKKPLEAHFHMDLGHGVSNTIIALALGVERMHTTVSGIGERAGNTPMEDTVLSLLMLYGRDIGIKTERFTELSQLVLGLAGVQIPPNRQIVGERLFHVESGIITDWLRNCGDEHATEVFPYRWDAVGQSPPKVVLGKGSGLASIDYWLNHIGIEVSDEARTEILTEVKRFSLQTKRLLDETEFGRIVAQVTEQRRVEKS